MKVIKLVGRPKQNFAVVTNFEAKKIMVSELFLEDDAPNQEKELSRVEK